LQVDHVVAEKHGGETVVDNLALACTFCNRFKGTDLGSMSESTGQLVRFFNPRTDVWADHFTNVNFQILPKDPIGEVTVRILQFNLEERVFERAIIDS